MKTTRRGAESSAAIRNAAIDLFYRRGFQAATLREIANRVGMQVGSLYNHIDSKGELLFEIMEKAMTDLLDEQRSVATSPDVVGRLRDLVHHHVRFHVHRVKEEFIGNSELRSLSPKQRARIVGLRREYEGLFEEALSSGISAGIFVAVDVKVAVYGILALASGVATWYSPRGRLSADQIADNYASLVVRGVASRRIRDHFGVSNEPTNGLIDKRSFVR